MDAREVIAAVTFWQECGETEVEKEICYSRADSILAALDAAGFYVGRDDHSADMPDRTVIALTPATRAAVA